MDPYNNGVASDVIAIPDKMVGLIIGKAGEQINLIQDETGTRIQFAPADGAGTLSRACTITGTPGAILMAKEKIQEIMSKGHDYPPGTMGGMGMGMEMNGGGNVVTHEMMIPGNRAGIIIGKGGETIKQLQERMGVRMVIIQQSNVATAFDKPLRITGDADKVQQAEDMIRRMIADRDDMHHWTYARSGYNDHGHKETIEMSVPRSVIGIVIGKGGDMIKRLQSESGARIQFKPDDDPSSQNRMCNITGSKDQTHVALAMINDIIQTNGNRGPSNNDWGGMGGGRNKYGNGAGDETTFSVPADKCGLVIGKGGETIREICRQSGAHVELNREAIAGENERVFRILGNPDEVRLAIQLVSEKAGVTAPQDSMMGVGMGVTGGLVPSSTPQNTALSGLYAAVAQGNSQVLYAGQQQQQQQPQQQQLAALQSSYQYQPAATAAYSQAAPAAASATDLLAKQAVDSTLWNAYYAQFYPQQQQQQSNMAAIQAAAASLQQLQQQQQAQQQYALAAAVPQQIAQSAAAQPAGLAAGALGATAAAPDYSAAWVEYYRQQQQQQALLLQLQSVSGAAAPTNGLGIQHQQQ